MARRVRAGPQARPAEKQDGGAPAAGLVQVTTLPLNPVVVLLDPREPVAGRPHQRGDVVVALEAAPSPGRHSHALHAPSAPTLPACGKPLPAAVVCPVGRQRRSGAGTWGRGACTHAW
ncbi:hypothetical protein GCM10027294_21910 [Marinactinospora endophytica]